MPSQFQYKAKSIFLTYSQCPVPKETMMAHLKVKIGTQATNQLLKACVGQEKHQDGNLHLHICAWYTQQLNFSCPKYLDIVHEETTYHPNVGGPRIQNKQKALQYCSKEDPEPLQFNMDIKSETAARESHTKIIGKRLIEKPTEHELLQVIEEHPEQLIHLSKW